MSPSRESRRVEGCFAALVVVLPLVYAPGFASLYRLPKQVALAVIGALVLWGVVAYYRRERPLSSLPLFAPVVAYATVIILSLLTALNLYEGLWQSAETLVALGLFWAAATFFGDMAAVFRLFRWAVGAATVVALLGIAQTWGADIPTLAITTPIVAPGSTFGNINMAAQYLVLVLPLAVGLVILASTLSGELVAGAALGVIATHLTYTGTRAAWLGATLATLVLSWLVRRRGILISVPPSPFRRKIWSLVAVAAFVVLMNIVPRFVIPGWGQSHASVVTRLGSFAGEFEERTSLRVRLAIWANTSALVTDHPLLGVGKGNFQFLYPRYARRVVEDVAMKPETRVREAHNDYVQFASETGLIGLGTFLCLLVGLARRFCSGFTATAEAGRLVIGGTCAIGLLALLVEAFFDFPFQRAVPEAFFWMLAGVLWRASGDDPPSVGGASSKPHPLIALTVVAVIATMAAGWGGNALRAEYHYSRGGRAYSRDRLPEAGEHLRKAVTLNPFEERYWFLLGLYEIRTGDFRQAVVHISRHLRLNPYNIGGLNNFGVALASVGRPLEAIAAFERSLAIWPDHVEARNNLGFLYASVGRRDLAITQFREVLRMSPGNEQARSRLDVLLQDAAR